jgi:hypothetical protein
MSDDLRAMLSEPEAIFEGQAVQGRHVIDGTRNFFNGRRSFRRGEDGRSHPGTSGVKLQDSRF